MAPPAISDKSTLFNVQGLVAVVTGGATGIGLMIANALESNGATVYITGRRADALEKAVNERNTHGNLIPLQGDVTDCDSLQSIVAQIKARHGYINLLVNNAGIMAGQQPELPGPKETDIKTLQGLLWNGEDFDTFSQAFKVNVAGVWFTTVAFLELLHLGNEHSKPRGVTSQIITISSLASLIKESWTPSLAYSVSKAATTHLGKMMANYFKDWHIRSNVVCPGFFPSEISEGFLSEDLIKNGIPLQRVGNMDDMGGLVLYLASRAGAYINGSVHVIDGGRLAQLPSTF